VRKSGGSPATIIMKSVRSTAARAIRRDEERRLTQTARVPGFYCRQANRPRSLGRGAMLTGAFEWAFNSLTDPTPLCDLRELNGSDCCFSPRSIIRRFRKG